MWNRGPIWRQNCSKRSKLFQAFQDRQDPSTLHMLHTPHSEIYIYMLVYIYMSDIKDMTGYKSDMNYDRIRV